MTADLTARFASLWAAEQSVKSARFIAAMADGIEAQRAGWDLAAAALNDLNAQLDTLTLDEGLQYGAFRRARLAELAAV